MHHLIALLVSTDTVENCIIRVQPASGSAAQSVDIRVDHFASGHAAFIVDPGAELLPGVFSAGHLLSLLLPAIYAKWGDAETFPEVFAEGAIDFQAPDVSGL